MFRSKSAGWERLQIELYEGENDERIGDVELENAQLKNKDKAASLRG
jgi:hypothetical protein